jgi:hypothetical protein
MEKVRFEVSLNGERLCTAGVGGYGVLMATILMTSHLKAEASVSQMVTIPHEYDLNFGVSALECNDSVENRHLTWINRSLREGDELRVRILPEGHIDPPILSFSDHASSCVNEEDIASGDEDDGYPPEDPPQDKDASGQVRFEVLANGTRLCIAGIDGNGILFGHVVSTSRHPNYARAHHLEGESAKDEMYMTIQGLDSSQTETEFRLVWIREHPLQFGDVILVRLLPPGECDAPTRLPSPEQAKNRD